MGKTSAIKLGVDLGGTKMYAIVLDENDEVISSARAPSNGHEGAEKGLETLLATAEQAIEDAKVGDATLVGIGVGCPGVVDFKTITVSVQWTDATAVSNDGLSRRRTRSVQIASGTNLR